MSLCESKSNLKSPQQPSRVFPTSMKCPLLQDELEALEAIYNDDKFTYDVQEIDHEWMEVSLALGDKMVRLKIPRDYPETRPLSTNTHLINIIEESWVPGNECLFQVIEGLRDKAVDLYLEDDEAVKEAGQLAAFEVQAEKEVALEDSDIMIDKGPIVEVNKSKFQAFCSQVHTMEDVDAFRNTVVSTKACSRATHNIMCYRFYDKTSGVLNHDYDDDGESAAGSRLAEMVRISGLVDQKEVPGIAVIVSRWYGGVLLGPDRFKIINNTARDLLEELGYAKKSAKPGSSRKKKKK
jgi:hypothetical protein